MNRFAHAAIGREKRIMAILFGAMLELLKLLSSWQLNFTWASIDTFDHIRASKPEFRSTRSITYLQI